MSCSIQRRKEGGGGKKAEAEGATEGVLRVGVRQWRGMLRVGSRQCSPVMKAITYTTCRRNYGFAGLDFTFFPRVERRGKLCQADNAEPSDCPLGSV